MAKKVNILLSLADKFSSPMKKVTGETETARRQMAKAQKQIQKFGSGFNKRVSGIVSGVGRMAVAFSGVGMLLSAAALTNFANKAVEASRIQTEAETKLGAVLQNVADIRARGANAWKDAQQNLMNYASELQAVGVIGDEVTLSGMQQLATFQLNDEQIKMLSSGMTDLIAQQKGLNATQEDAVGIANMIGKAMDGNAGALSRVGITMTDAQKEIIKTGDKMQRAAVIAEVLKQNVGGVNAALAKTDAGKMKQAENTLGDMMEDIGKKIIPLKAAFFGLLADVLPVLKDGFLTAFDSIAVKLNQLSAYFQDHKEQIKSGLAVAVTVLGVAFDVLGGTLGFVINHLGIIAPLFAGLVGYLTALSIGTKVVAAFMALSKAMATVSTVGGIFNAVLAANPLVLIAAGVGLLIAALAMLYIHFDSVSAAWNSVCNMFVSAWEAIKSAFVTAIEFIGNLVVTVFNFYINTWITILQTLLDFLCGVFGVSWADVWNSAVSVFTNVFETVKDIATSVLGWITEKLDKVGNALSNLNPFGGGGKPQGFATGTSYFGGGIARINEHGGEIVNLPSGTQIIPHDISKRAVGGSQNITVNVNVQGNVIGNEEFMNETGAHIAERVRFALGNM